MAYAHAAPIPADAATADRASAGSAPVLRTGRVTGVQAPDRYAVECPGGGADMAASASVGVLLPELVPGDEVLLAVRSGGEAVITAVLAPSPAVPWNQRTIRLQSQDAVVLSCGEASLRLTGQGLARLVALKIEHDARDLVDIDAAEVRIN